MFRRLSATSLLLASSLVVACGHQVTPNPPNPFGDLAGHMQIKFQTSGPMDFTNVVYVIAIDTCGPGVPYPNAFASGSYASYSFAFLVGGGVGGTAQPLLYQYYLNSSSSGNLTKLQVNNLNPSTTIFTYPYQQQTNEFEFTFLRSDLNNPEQVPLPCPNSTATPVPTPSPSATPTVSAGASPTPTPIASGTATATPSASPTPSPTPTGADDSTGVNVPPYQTTWTFNLMTFAPGSLTPLDSLGLGGPNDTSFSGVTVFTPTSGTYFQNRQPPYVVPANPAAYVTYAEVDTYQ